MPRRERSPAPRRETTPRAIALIGSSGGSTLRGAASHEAETIIKQLGALPAGSVALKHAIFVETNEPLDHASKDAPASLWTLDGASIMSCSRRDSLAAVNRQAAKADKELARYIRGGQVDAIVVVSPDFRPGGVNTESLAAAVEA